jgi:hypothetical protein
MIARAPTRCGSRSVIHGGPRGDDQRVVAPGGFSNAIILKALPGVGVAHLRKAEDHQIGMDIGSCHGDHWAFILAVFVALLNYLTPFGSLRCDLSRH